MAIPRQEAIHLLRQVGRADVAERVEAELPETVDKEVLLRFVEQFGVTRSFLVSRMGGSP